MDFGIRFVHFIKTEVQNAEVYSFKQKVGNVSEAQINSD